MNIERERLARAGEDWARTAILVYRRRTLHYKRIYGKRYAYRRPWIQAAWDLRRLLREQRDRIVR